MTEYYTIDQIKNFYTEVSKKLLVEMILLQPLVDKHFNSKIFW